MTDVTRLKAQGLGDVIRDNAARFPDRVAFVDDGGPTTFAAFDRRTRLLCAAMRRAGLRAGDRVAVLSRNCVAIVEVIALARSGIVPVPLNWRLAAPELIALLRDCRPHVLFASDEFADLADCWSELDTVAHRVVFGGERDGWTSYEGLLSPVDEFDSPWVEPVPGDIACIVYTSGTTGQPKGAMLTHGAILENARDAAGVALHLTPEDVTLAVMPLSHVGGLFYHLIPSFAAGCTTVIRPGFAVNDALSAMDRHGITNVHLVPTMLGELIAAPEVARASRRLRVVFYAASSIPGELLRRAMAVLDQCSFVQSYGSTEAGTVTVLTPEDHARAARDPAQEHLLLSCGRPLGQVQVRIDASEGAPGGAGEIIVRSGKTMAGYWNRSDATDAVLADGWVRTGDVGRMDARGYLYIVDRKSDMVITGGENVFPFEVEEVLAGHSAVAEAAVFGLPDPRWVERVVAAIVLKPGADATPAEILLYARGWLAGYKCPKDIFAVDSLPRSAVGKILRKELRKQFAGPAA